MREVSTIDINGEAYEISDKKAQAELVAARFDNSGNVYPSAGDAMRALESKVESGATSIETLRQSVSRKSSIQIVHWEEDD